MGFFTGLFMGCIIGYFVNKYDDNVLATVKRWWAALERRLGINQDDSNKGA